MRRSGNLWRERLVGQLTAGAVLVVDQVGVGGVRGRRSRGVGALAVRADTTAGVGGSRRRGEVTVGAEEEALAVGVVATARLVEATSATREKKKKQHTRQCRGRERRKRRGPVVPDTSRADTVVAVRVAGASSTGDTAEVGASLGLLDALGASRGRAVAAVEAVVRATSDRLEVITAAGDWSTDASSAH